MSSRATRHISGEARFAVIEGGKKQSPGAACQGPSFSTLEYDPAFWRLATNLAACISAPPRGVPRWGWAHAPMFRSAYLRKRYPLRSFLASLLLHVAGFAALMSLPDLGSSSSQIMALDARAAERTIIYYTKADLMPAISPPKQEPRTARPRPAPPRVEIRRALHPAQEIVSKPPAPDNRRQTIIQPAPLHLRVDVRVPNLVSWVAPQIVPPAPSVREAQRALAQIRLPILPAPKIAVLRPVPSPPKLEALRADAANVPLAPVSTTEIPKLPVPVRITPAPPRPPQPVSGPAPEPRAAPSAPRIQADANAPLPAILQNGAADLVAVSLAPAPPEKEIVVPQGSRAGEFQASPNGADAESGPVQPSSDVVVTSSEAGSVSADLAGRELADLRAPGLSVSGGPAPQPGTVVEDRSEDFRRLLARATRPSLVPEMSRERPLEPEFFGNRRVYTTYLNMPNLSSGSGSWVMRFAELEEESAAARGELSTPEAIRKVDPKYVSSAVREKIQGTVMLAALLLKDGSVANIRVVRSLDERLDSSAVSALTQWQFRPAMRNGAAVNLEVLVQIPFRLPSF